MIRVLKRVIKKFLTKQIIVKVSINTVAPNAVLMGKTALITGANSGIGLAIAKRFLDEGARVIITGRDEIKLQKVCSELKGKNISFICWDISDVHKTKLIFDQKIRKEKIDIFVNNAGVYDKDNWQNISPEMYEKVVGINQTGLFFICQEEGKYLIENKIEGKIINITSIAGIESGFTPYNVSKWGATCITKGLAKVLLSYGIRVNAIAPGNVVTNIHEDVRGKNVFDNAYTPQHPTNRYTLVEEIASMSLFLASDQANNMVGQVIAIDGGWTLS